MGGKSLRFSSLTSFKEPPAILSTHVNRRRDSYQDAGLNSNGEERVDECTKSTLTITRMKPNLNVRDNFPRWNPGFSSRDLFNNSGCGTNSTFDSSKQIQNGDGFFSGRVTQTIRKRSTSRGGEDKHLDNALPQIPLKKVQQQFTPGRENGNQRELQSVIARSINHSHGDRQSERE